MARLFFALWPDAGARAALAELARSTASRHGGRAVPAANLHLTLVFLGEVDPARIGALRTAAEGLACPGFALALDRVGGFRRAGVAWAGCRRPPPALLALQSELEKRIREAGFSPDDRAFAPHLTLARRVRDAVAEGDVESVAWRASEFALVETARGGGAYRTLAVWPLGEGKT
jgi:2'-5' RNA ligase